MRANHIACCYISLQITVYFHVKRIACSGKKKAYFYNERFGVNKKSIM